MRLASQLTGLDIDIMTEEEESKRRQAEFEERTKLFVDALDLDEFFAQLLVAEGFTNLEEVAYVDLDDLTSIDGVDESTAAELQARAPRPYRGAGQGGAGQCPRAGGRGQPDQLRRHHAPDGRGACQGRRQTLEDFATLADWEIAGGWTTVNGERVKDEGILEKFDVSLEEAQTMVMTARVMLGWVDPDVWPPRPRMRRRERR